MINDSVAVPLEHSTKEKDLGVWTDDKLKFAGHVGHIVAKGGQLLGLIKRSFVHRDVDVIKTLYTVDIEWIHCVIANQRSVGDSYAYF